MTKNTKKSLETESDSLQPRQIKNDRYASFRMQKRIKPGVSKLPNAFRLFGTASKTLAANWKLFLGITLVYGVLNVILVQGLSAGTNLEEIKQSLDGVFIGNFAELATGATLFLQMLSTVGSTTNQAAGAYQLMLVLTTSLAFIWALRQVYAKHKVRIRDGFYRGMYPLVPFLLVLAVTTLQLIPAFIGVFAYSQIVVNSIGATPAEFVLWGGIFFVLAVVSLYMICSSLFALYAVCLPDMTPLHALRSARDLVRHRRCAVMRKVLFLPLALITVAGIIMIPIIMFASGAAAWVFIGLNMVVLAVVHSYMYTLYRALL